MRSKFDETQDYVSLNTKIGDNERRVYIGV
jgi:hypothetical protein